MTGVLIVIALLFYGVRFAASGIDNGLYYAALSKRPRVLPDIHHAEVAQSWSSHLSVAALLAAVLLESGPWSWLRYGLALAAMHGIQNAFAPAFNYYVHKAIGGLAAESTHWAMPFWKPVFKLYWLWRIPLPYVRFLPVTLQVPKLWAGRRRWQAVYGATLFTVSIIAFLLV